MSTFSIEINNVKVQIDQLRKYSQEIGRLHERLSSIRGEISLDSNTSTIKKAIETQENALQQDEQLLLKTANQLAEIINVYTSAEQSIMGNTISANNPNLKTEDETVSANESETDKEPFDLDKWVSENTGIPEDVLEIIKFILGFIPVVNCVTDIYQIVDDVSKALADDKQITAGECAALVVDVVFLGLDIFAAGEIIKGAKAAIKTAKAAKVEAKVATETAERLAKKAEKTAAAASKNKQIKAVTKRTAKKIKKAETAAKNTAKKAKKAALKAEEAAKNAVEAPKNAVKKVTTDIIKGTGDNIINEYSPTPDNGQMPFSIIRSTRDDLINEY